MSVDVGGKEMFCVAVRVTINPPTSILLSCSQFKLKYCWDIVRNGEKSRHLKDLLMIGKW